jgi:DNA-binding NarL/FixJ family response regulator
MFMPPRQHGAVWQETIVENGSGDVVRLSAHEAQVLRLVRDGFSDREIASTLATSDSTVRTHLATLARKLGMRRGGRVVAQGEGPGLL